MLMIHKTKKVYEVEYFDAEGARIKELFGTTVIPTPFFPSMPAKQVKFEIQTLNPDEEVLICQCANPDLAINKS